MCNCTRCTVKYFNRFIDRVASLRERLEDLIQRLNALITRLFIDEETNVALRFIKEKSECARNLHEMDLYHEFGINARSYLQLVCHEAVEDRSPVPKFPREEIATLLAMDMTRRRA